MRLTVIIIGRNEELHIARCIDSVLSGTREIGGSEIVYVDSASTDRTVDIARKYPVRILQLRPSWPLSAAAGRYIGSLWAQGEYLFFIDGDSVVREGWLELAMAFMDESPEVGGVAGMVDEIFVNDDGCVVGERPNRYHQSGEPVETKTTGGIALFRRSVLDHVGSFNPFIPVDEERELCLRIRRAGHRIVRLAAPMAVTHAPPRDTCQEIFRRLNSNLYALGIPMRYCLQNGNLGQYARERLGFLAAYAGGLLALMAMLALAALRGDAVPLALGGAGMVAAVVYLRVRRKGLHSPGLSFLKRTLILAKTIQSFATTRPRPPASYPTDAVIIQT